MKKSNIELFIERVKVEANIHKIIKKDLIYQLIDYFKRDYTKMNYPQNINNPLETVLEFYKNYNLEYYEIIVEGIKNNKILIDKNNTKSFMDTKNGKLYIKLFRNDLDVFMLAHEFAHYIDRSFNPPIIPNEYNFLCEVYSFCIEKKLEDWLDNEKNYELINVKRNNRMYYVSKMLSAIESMMFYEELYTKNGKINIEDLDINIVKKVMNYDYDLEIGLVNYLLRYPLANILSDYLINNNMIEKDTDIYKACLNTNLYQVMPKSNIKKELVI